MATNDFEFRVKVEKRELLSDRDGGDQAVDQAANRLTALSAQLIDGGGRLIVLGTAVAHAGDAQESAKLDEVIRIASPCQYLHQDSVADGDLGIEEAVHLFADPDPVPRRNSTRAELSMRIKLG